MLQSLIPEATSAPSAALPRLTETGTDVGMPANDILEIIRDIIITCHENGFVVDVNNGTLYGMFVFLYKNFPSELTACDVARTLTCCLWLTIVVVFVCLACCGSVKTVRTRINEAYLCLAIYLVDGLQLIQCRKMWRI